MPGGFEMLKDSPILQVALTDSPGGPDGHDAPGAPDGHDAPGGPDSPGGHQG